LRSILARAFVLSFSLLAAAQSPPALNQRIQQIVSQPQFKHALFGIEFYDLASRSVVFSLNGDKLFVPGSTTKLVTEGAALAILGPDYRFHTRVYRHGPVSPDGTLNGDLVLVAGGDLNLSARVVPGDTLAYTDYDHAYAGWLPGTAVPGDPLVVLKALAKQVAAHGIKRVQGQVLIDASLFTAGKTDPGTGATISPIMVNDNIVDVTVLPAPEEGGRTVIMASPWLSYVKFIDQIKTGKPDSDARFSFGADVTNPDGSHTVTIDGNIPAGWQSELAAYKVKDPVRFADFAFAVALMTAGIQSELPAAGTQADFAALAASYSPENLVAEHISPPFAAEVKLTLKVSQNLHAATMPYLLGALRGQQHEPALQAGFALEQEFLKQAGLDLTAASQADGAGGPGAAFTPDFMVRYLAYVAKQPYGQIFYDALPIMGRDGTLSEVLKNSPAAGHVHAKTGTYVYYNELNRTPLLLSKGLVGYVETRTGRKLAFAAYVNQVPGYDAEMVGEQLAQIAAAAY
jgi:D-alanyl-D-alanine carboxypeptidase/D-alanyl-D-alanine-endopeptidase (penicillin-binding protein 4)